MKSIKRVTAKDIYEMTSVLDEQMEKKIDKWLLAHVGDFASGSLRVYQGRVNINLKVLEKSLNNRGFDARMIGPNGEIRHDPYLQVSIPQQGE